jgi:hypothetical protein
LEALYVCLMIGIFWPLLISVTLMNNLNAWHKWVYKIYCIFYPLSGTSYIVQNLSWALQHFHSSKVPAQSWLIYQGASSQPSIKYIEWWTIDAYIPPSIIINLLFPPTFGKMGHTSRIIFFNNSLANMCTLWCLTLIFQGMYSYL